MARPTTMNGREKLIVLVVYLTLIGMFDISLVVAFLKGSIDFDSYVAQAALVLNLVGGLLIKLPPGKDENVDVSAQQVEVSVDEKPRDPKADGDP